MNHRSVHRNHEIEVRHRPGGVGEVVELGIERLDRKTVRRPLGLVGGVAFLQREEAHPGHAAKRGKIG